MVNKPPLNACPHCGSDYGYYRLSKVGGFATISYKWDGSDNDNTAMHDSITYKDQKTLRCCQCHKIVRSK